MTLVFTPFTPVLLASIGVSFGLASYVILHATDGAKPAEAVGVIAVLLGAGWWATMDAVMVSSNSLATMQLSQGFETIGGTTIAIGWFVFAAGYTDRRDWLSKRILVPLVVILGLGVALSVTNPVHELFFTDARRVPVGSFYSIEQDATLAHTLYDVANYVPILAGTYAIAHRIFTDRTIYRLQVVALIVAVAVPLAANLKRQFGVGPYPDVHFSSMAFTVTGVALTVGVLRYRLLDVNAVARRRAIGEMQEGYLVVDDADRIADYNRAATDLLNTEDLIGESVATLFPDGWNSSEEAEFVIDRREDSHYIEVSRTSLEHGQELLLLRDVTERRAVEKRYQRLIEMASDVVVVADETGEVTFVSPSVERVLGIDPAQLEGQDVYSTVHSADRGLLEESLERIRENPADIHRIECRVLDADGNVETVDVLLRNLLDDPYVEGLVANARVVTERKERERELQRRNDRLDQFASIVSHDLRNPLNVAKARLELAAAEVDEMPHFDSIGDALDRMETIIDDTLTLARQGETVAKMQPVSMGQIARRSWDQITADEATLDVQTQFRIQGDPDRLAHVFENLFRNAIEHGGADVTVRVGRLDDGFYVEDDGPGIPPEKRDEVFDPGETSDPDGTGFGLAIVEEIVSAHGWTVSVTTGTDGGARFEFTGVDLSTDAESPSQEP